MNKSLDFLTQAVERLKSGDMTGPAWVYYRSMTQEDRIRFDGWLVQTNDPLAWEAGPAFDRFHTRARRMAGFAS